MKSQIRIGIIGCGVVSDSHISGYLKIPGVEVIALCDLQLEMAKKAAESHSLDVPTYGDYRQMLDREKLDGLSICTPPSSHARIAVDALQRGVHVLCEKPLSTSVKEARTMVKAARRSRRLLMTAFAWRFREPIRRARELVAAGEIGEPIICRNMFICRMPEIAHGTHAQRGLSGGGVIMDNGSHSADMMRFVLGEVKNVSARMGIFLEEMELEDTAQILLEMESGAQAVVSISWATPVPRELCELEIYGSRGSLLASGSRLRYRVAEGDWVEPDLSGSLNPFDRETAHFVACLRGQEEPEVDGIAGLRAQEIVAAAYRSIEKSAWVPVKRIRV